MLPALGLLWGWHRLTGRPLRTALMRSAGLAGLALIASVASGLPHFPDQLAYEIGGFFGTEISSRLLIPYIGRPGSVVLLSALLAASLLVGTDVRVRHCLAPFRFAAAAVQALGRWFSRPVRRRRRAYAKVEINAGAEAAPVAEFRQLPEPLPRAARPEKDAGAGEGSGAGADSGWRAPPGGR